MGILKRPKYQETETDKMIKRQLKEAQEERIKKEEAMIGILKQIK